MKRSISETIIASYVVLVGLILALLVGHMASTIYTLRRDGVKEIDSQVTRVSNEVEKALNAQGKFDRNSLEDIIEHNKRIELLAGYANGERLFYARRNDGVQLRDENNAKNNSEQSARYQYFPIRYKVFSDVIVDDRQQRIEIDIIASVVQSEDVIKLINFYLKIIGMLLGFTVLLMLINALRIRSRNKRAAMSGIRGQESADDGVGFNAFNSTGAASVNNTNFSFDNIPSDDFVDDFSFDDEGGGMNETSLDELEQTLLKEHPYNYEELEPPQFAPDSNGNAFAENELPPLTEPAGDLGDLSFLDDMDSTLSESGFSGSLPAPEEFSFYEEGSDGENAADDDLSFMNNLPDLDDSPDAVSFADYESGALPDNLFDEESAADDFSFDDEEDMPQFSEESESYDIEAPESVLDNLDLGDPYDIEEETAPLFPPEESSADNADNIDFLDSIENDFTNDSTPLTAALDNFNVEQSLDSALHQAADGHTDLSVFCMALNEGDNVAFGKSLTKFFADNYQATVSVAENDTYYVIMPDTKEAKALQILRSFQNDEPHYNAAYGISARFMRDVSADLLLREATTALRRAQNGKDNAVIAFKADKGVYDNLFKHS
jgi:hypothetical protein